MLNGVGPRREVLIQDIAVEPNTAFPGNGRGMRIDAHLLELAHIPPQLERADLEQVAEEHRAFESVLEAQPQLVILLGLACCDSMHLIPLLFHVALPRRFFSHQSLRVSIIPSSVHRPSGTRSPASRRSCVPS